MPGNLGEYSPGQLVLIYEVPVSWVTHPKPGDLHVASSNHTANVQMELGFSLDQSAASPPSLSALHVTHLWDAALG